MNPLIMVPHLQIAQSIYLFFYEHLNNSHLVVNNYLVVRNLESLFVSNLLCKILVVTCASEEVIFVKPYWAIFISLLVTHRITRFTVFYFFILMSKISSASPVR